MYTFKLNLYPKCAVVCNNCKWFKMSDRSDISTGIPTDKLGIGQCECGKSKLLFGGWRPSLSLKRLYETCQKFEFDIHQKFGLTLDETEDYFNYIDFLNNHKIFLIREYRQWKEAKETWNKIKTTNNGTA